MDPKQVREELAIITASGSCASATRATVDAGRPATQRRLGRQRRARRKGDRRREDRHLLAGVGHDPTSRADPAVGCQNRHSDGTVGLQGASVCRIEAHNHAKKRLRARSGRMMSRRVIGSRSKLLRWMRPERASKNRLGASRGTTGAPCGHESRCVGRCDRRAQQAESFSPERTSLSPL